MRDIQGELFMPRGKKLRIGIGYSLMIIFIVIIIASSTLLGQADETTEVKEKLNIITEEEKEILQNLFILSQEIELMEKEEVELSKEIDIIREDITKLEALIKEEENNYKSKESFLKEVLKNYQRRGPGSYLEILLDSESITTFIRKLNILRDLTRNTGKLLESLEENKLKLEAEKKKLDGKLNLVEGKKIAMEEAIINKIKLKEELETYLSSLESERAYYEEYSNRIQELWKEFKPLFAKTSKEFTKIIREESIPSEALNLTISFTKIKASIKDETFNNILKEWPSLSNMTVKFNTEEAKIVLYDNLVLKGIFVIREENVLLFEVQEGSFYGLPLEARVLEELFKDNEIVLDLRPLLGKNVLNAIEIKDGSLELTVKPVLF